MAIPDFIVDIRKKIGHDPLWLPAITAIVLREQDATKEVLLAQRADNGNWAPVTGICDPGEQPEITAVREVLEETALDVRIDSLLWVHAVGPITHANDDIAAYMDIAFSCSPVGESDHVNPADGENTKVVWWDVEKLPDMQERFHILIARAAQGHTVPGWGDGIGSTQVMPQSCARHSS